MKWFFLLILVAIILAVSRRSSAEVARKTAALTGRPALSLKAIYEEHFREKGIRYEVFEAVWTKVGSLLCVPAEKLRPGDRFDEELRLDDGFGPNDDLIELEEWYVEEAARAGVGARPVMTLEQLVVEVNGMKREGDEGSEN